MILLISSGIYHEMDFFLWSVITGSVLMLVSDLLKVVRSMIRHGTLALAIEDMVYWFLAAIAVFFMVFMRNDGLVRGFSAIGIILGALVFKWTFGHVFDHFVKKLKKNH